MTFVMQFRQLKIITSNMTVLRIICANLKRITPVTLNVSVQNAFFKRFGQLRRLNTRVNFKAEKLRNKDQIHENYELIYRNQMNKYFVAAQIFSITALAAGTVIVLRNEHKQEIKFGFNNEPKQYKDELVIYITAIMGFAVLLQSMIYKCPIRIYNDPHRNKYVLIFYRSLPFFTRKLQCTVKDVTKIEGNNIIPWSNSQYEIENKQKVILIENYFRRPADLHIMLGEQIQDTE